MIKEFDFVKVVKNMTAKQIIMSMVNGLKNPITEIRMNTYGCIYNNICYGNASTNTICYIAAVTTEEFLKGFNERHRESYGEKNIDFLDVFEKAIAHLCMGNVNYYNILGNNIKIAKIYNNSIINLPILNDNFTYVELYQYIKLANIQ